MHIPPFPLPSNVNTIVNFRVPTVEDGLLFAAVDASQEEALTTQYLDHMQDRTKNPDGKVIESGNWTGEDRRTALWWIFIASQDTPEATFGYKCSMCKKEHYADLNLADLGDTSVALTKTPEMGVEFTSNGNEFKGSIKPMNGFSAEHVESLRNIRDSFEKGSIEHIKAGNDMRMAEMAHCISIEGQPVDHNEAFEFRMGLIKTMHLDTEFRALSAKIEQALRRMRHGLLTKYHDGRFLMVADFMSKCDETGEEKQQTLLLPFRAHDFIATL